ncbi:MAG TPA: GPMC system MBL fold metallohydrolase [Geobacteraceae bacterium]|nr:GPMC system MBL fold metallohydrolase [Geobacteraceae bacterium]
MKITILGSGTSTGVPMVGCHCPVCASSDPKDRRSRASILIEVSDRLILIDTSPDLRRQALANAIPHIDAVLFTHTHADHINGIDDLRGYHLLHKRVVPCYGTRETLNEITRNFTYIFSGAPHGGYTPLLEAHAVSGPFNLFGQKVTPIPLIHGCSHSTGYRIADVAYLTDCSRIPDTSMLLLAGLDILILDALRYTPHVSHFNIEESLQVVKALKPRRAVLTHLTHEVAHRDGKKLPPGVEFAFDGMILQR